MPYEGLEGHYERVDGGSTSSAGKCYSRQVEGFEVRAAPAAVMHGASPPLSAEVVLLQSFRDCHFEWT